MAAGRREAGLMQIYRLRYGQTKENPQACFPEVEAAKRLWPQICGILQRKRHWCREKCPWGSPGPTPADSCGAGKLYLVNTMNGNVSTALPSPVTCRLICAGDLQQPPQLQHLLPEAKPTPILPKTQNCPQPSPHHSGAPLQDGGMHENSKVDYRDRTKWVGGSACQNFPTQDSPELAPQGHL